MPTRCARHGYEVAGVRQSRPESDGGRSAHGCPTSPVIYVACGDEPDGASPLCRDLACNVGDAADLCSCRRAIPDFDIVAGLRIGPTTISQGRDPAPAHAAHRGAVPARSTLLAAPPSSEDVRAGELELDVKRMT